MNLPRRLRRLFRRRQTEAEMAEEMRFHLEQRAADFAEDGYSADDARTAAQRKFGNVGSLQEQARDSYGWGWLERAITDLRLGIRRLVSAPGFTVLAIVTLALGIGANTAMFSTLSSIMFRPLPYPNSEQLDRIDRVTPQSPARGRHSPADWLELRRNSSEYGEVGAYWVGDTSLADPGRPAEFARAARASANFFSVLRVTPSLGRSFRNEEELPGRDRVVIISQPCWLNRIGGRTDIIGHEVRIDGESHKIIGVLPASFNDGRHLGPIEIFRPLALDDSLAAERRRFIIAIIGRRSSEHAPGTAPGIIARLGERLAQEHPEVNAGTSWRAVALNDAVMDSDGRATFAMLIALSGFVLLIACSNLANLLLARTIAAAREYAVRAALGATRLQLLRPLITESLLLAIAGGGGALLLCSWALDYLSLRTTDDSGARLALSMDGRALAWASAVSLLTALTFGIGPALFAMRLNVNDTLKSGGRGATGGRGHQRFRHGLVIAQFALAMILLAGAALFIRGLDELNSRRAGWSSERLITGTIALPAARYPDNERMNAFHRLAVERIESMPGVDSVSLSAYTPFLAWPDVRKFVIGGATPPPPGREPASTLNRVSPEYFATVGTRIVAGRGFSDADNANSNAVFIISQSTATAWFGKENPLGRRIAQAGSAEPQWGEIVGVAADVSPAVDDKRAVTLQLYRPLAQEPIARAELSVRTATASPATMIESIRSTVTGLDPDLPVRNLRTADATIVRANYQLAVLRDMLSTFAALGLALASLGIYGVITRTMAQRSSEFAIRLALGACVRDIARLVLGSGVKLALIGAAVGLLGAIGVSQLIVAFFPKMHFNSPVAIGSTTLLLIGVALLACWLPARRAGRVNAMQALRAD